ncbi:hypothetical protein HH308_02515 [Gordonia sp. TBRC 11910]|uniref:Uncharacterized protein n=1 Tax=Gordonia asplenii TaxID=2725283 RepID=A0A848KLW9_9ACTN|nr:hypothetical protein [Gordonia asplenii]NMO00084.1 hypothetical protein [Gordonia asplenii]
MRIRRRMAAAIVFASLSVLAGQGVAAAAPLPGAHQVVYGLDSPHCFPVFAQFGPFFGVACYV